MTKNPNLQDVFLSSARRGEIPVTVFLVNGFQMRGTITGFDPSTVTVSAQGKHSPIYKPAIPTIPPARPADPPPWENGE